jgi:cytochrome oxidase Cu insertion factor (SCO1/SenC/PrrC family)
MLIKDSVSAAQRINSPDLQIVVISIDPWRDTPGSLESLAQTWSLGPKSHLLSGEPEKVLNTLDEFQVKTARDLKTGEVNHAGQIMLVDRQGKMTYSFLNPSVDWIITAAGRLLRE